MSRFFVSACLLASLLGYATASLAQQQTPPAAVITAEVTESALSYSEVFTGRVEAVQHVDIRARVAGFVEEVGFAEGQSVTAGDVLFKIEPDAYQAAIQQIEGQIASAQAERDLAEIELNRQQELLSRDVAPESAVEEAQAQAGKLAGEIQQLEGALQNAQLDLSYTTVEAPFDGRVGLTDIDVGAFVGVDSGTLVSLSSVDPIYVTFPIPEAVLLDVQKRHAQTDSSDVLPSAQITLANGDIYGETGTVEVVDTVVQVGTDTILIRAAFANPAGLLRDGQLVTIELVEEDAETALTFPVQALQRDQAGYFVYTVDADSTAQKTTIVVERVAGALVAVASGLNEGDEVIVDGVQKVTPGAIVQVAPAGGASAQ